ncbi:hypothetical protein GLAREA_05155 [Glarea lozoyensis ATCC 20868]|uniref:Uncharacterized protein n=1 Tax=Glarea lozoyensis (strain ATCC 20868 / MF5171) TaxID=1116229 RepID=S3DBL6_GLAL2|nr:uncharacterized protein GLAREA_05155 [Glarea lozoyensis ATCC 20868]EPE35817.1 hypothetical protein GLAREA_05155 [Glarea lozoyensis ATCC 20868]
MVDIRPSNNIQLHSLYLEPIPSQLPASSYHTPEKWLAEQITPVTSVLLVGQEKIIVASSSVTLSAVGVASDAGKKGPTTPVPIVIKRNCKKQQGRRKSKKRKTRRGGSVRRKTRRRTKAMGTATKRCVARL